MNQQNENPKNRATAVLLPAARVAVFSKDEATLKTAQKITSDWRFARVDLEIQSGDVATATSFYDGQTSPDLIIVQTDLIDEDFINALGSLAGSCDEGTAAIVVGPDNDVNLYRKLIDMGVSDYLVRPLKIEVLGEIIAKTLIEKLGVSGSRLIAFIGSKGGVGTSALAQAAAWGISDILEQKSLFIDASGGWSVASVGMGFEPVTTLAESVGAAENEDDDSFKRMLFTPSDKLSVLASGAEIMLESGISGSEFERLLDFALAKYPAVIVDLSQAVPSLMYTVLNKANEIIVVSSASVSALRLSRSLMQEIKNLRGDEGENIHFILNMVGIAPANEVPKKDIEKAMSLKPEIHIAYNPAIFWGSESEGKKIIDNKDGRTLVKTQILPLFAKTFNVDINLSEGEVVQNENLFSGLLSKLKTK